MRTVSRKHEINMLDGPLAGPMLSFALPLIASGMLQQSFNSVDIAVAGRFAGHGALAAVGSNGPVISLLINMFLGLSVGVNVVIANYIGRGNRRAVSTAVGTSVFLSLVCGIGVLILAQTVARPLLTALDTPAEVLDDAVTYLRIFALGIPFLLLFNFGAAILRSFGDTRRPFYSLVAAGLVNVALNFVFVVGMGMGVAGVAWGTVVSNIVNATIITVILLKDKGDARLVPAQIRPRSTELAKISRIGLPAGLQSTVFSFSNVFILSAINGFGAKAAAGSAAAINFEIYCYFVISAFAQTAVAFTSQNYGAGQRERCRRILTLSLVMSMISSGLMAFAIAWLRDLCLQAFTDNGEVLSFASERIVTVLIFQFIACYYEMSGAAMRGMGHSLTPALITVFGTCVIRLLWVGFFPADGSFSLLLTIYPVSWALTDVMMFAAYRRLAKREFGGESLSGTQKVEKLA